MRRTLLVTAIALALGIVQASFVRALPGSMARVDLPLIMVVALVTGFRFGDAFAAAAAAGLATDTLSSLPFGSVTAVLLVLTAVTVALFSRVFTHHTWLGAVGINAAAFVLSGLLLAVLRAVRAVFAGFPAIAATGAAQAAAGGLAALGWQLLAVVLSIAIAAFLRRSFSRFFYLRRDA